MPPPLSSLFLLGQGWGGGGGTVVLPSPLAAPRKCLSYLSQASLVPALFVLTLGGVYLLFLVCQ